MGFAAGTRIERREEWGNREGVRCERGGEGEKAASGNHRRVSGSMRSFPWRVAAGCRGFS